ncbi:Werner Syndrome-like exonuclease [Lolium rigidum]|uniref:Werner Syndrome-like exonuclease n=1 Tax=Lolium rigidum TaxID=89674 RepID=UPI001F5C254D|nr:Werner Syndrome-like exonuclease [Lolium rigidum]
MAAETYVTYVAFQGHSIKTTVTSSGTAVKRWLREIRYMYRWVYHKLIVGLDVEWRPSFSRVQNPVALLQLCVGRRCLIFQLIHADYIPSDLAMFLADPGIRFVGVRLQRDANLLSKDYRLQLANTIDLRGLAADGMQMPWLRQVGLKGIASAVMGANIEKPQSVRVGPWDAYRLSDEQIHYACIDAFASFEIGRKFLTGDYPPAHCLTAAEDYTSDYASDED